MAPTTDADEAASVVAWFQFYTRLYEDDARVARPSHTLLQLLQAAFPTLYEEVATRRLALGADEWACVIILLEAFYEVELGIDRSALNDAMTFDDASLHTACVNTLEYAVSALVQSDSKARFVGDIMTMDDSVQVDIMAVIERVLKHTASLTNNRLPGEEDSEPTRYEHHSHEHSSGEHYLGTPTRSLSGQTGSFSSPASMTSRSPLHLATHGEMERLQRANDILKEDNIHVAKELQDIKAKLSHAQAENAILLENIQSTKLQAEMDVLKKERTVRSYFDERVHTMQRELDRLTAELEEKSAVAREVNELRDEIDLLRPSADKLARAEATLVKYKTKIEDLASVSERLRRTEEANADLVEKNLLLEKQAAKSTMLQRKLADSKEANTTIQFHVSELESKLSRLTAELEAKRLECDSTSAALLEAKSMNNQLLQTVDQQIDAKGGFASSVTASAGGISELNPELMEKLARLEHENATLRSQVDGTTSDRIDALLDEIDDLKRMKKSFETKYFDTTDALKETEAKLANAEETVSKLREDLGDRTQELHETTANRDKLIHTLEDAEQRVHELTGLNALKEVEIHRRVELEQGLNSEISQRSEEISSLQLTLHQATQQLQLSNGRNDRLCEDISAHQWARRDLVTHRDELLDRIDGLGSQCSSLKVTIAELENESEGLREQLDDAKKQISNLRERGNQFAMSCEELRGILITKAAQIDTQTITISQLTQTTLILEEEIVELNVERQSRDAHIQILTERLNVTSEDLALIQRKRFDLTKEVEKQQDQDRHRQEELKKSADDRARLIADHASEVERLSQESADTITRMTSMIDEKCSMLQQSKDEMAALCEAHERAMSELRSRLQQELAATKKQKDELAAEFALYTAKHSYADKDVISREAALHEQLSKRSAMSAEEMARMGERQDLLSDHIKRLQDANSEMKARFESQEVKLREAVKSQLEANRKLMEVNQVIKNKLAKKEAQVVQLENAATRLDSKIRMLERERTHYSADDSGKREPDESSTSYSSQLNSHMTQIMEELAAVRNENKLLQEQLVRRFDEHTDNRNGAAQQSTKTYLLEKIRQLELANAQERDKKREMLMINAKLIQDQAQIQVRNASDSKEVQALKEKVNTWMLRDERRKKEHEAFAQRVRDLESENMRLRESRVQTGEVEAQSCLGAQEPLDSLEETAPLASRESSEDQENIPPTEDPPSPIVLQKKRKIDSLNEHEDVPESDEDSHQDNEVVAATFDDKAEAKVELTHSASSPIAAPRAKRRMSLFFSNRLASAAVATTQQADEKPSECQQQ